jgi:hypothetical protein
MRAWLHLQEGPGAGDWHPLNPASQPRLTVGRSSDCDVVLRDIRASRHHADIRWDGQQRAWVVVDNRSTNHTYVNGMEVHGPYALRLGDRITIGETTMVLHDFSADPSGAAPSAQPARDREQPAGQRQRTAGMQHLAPAGPGMPPAPPARVSRPASQPRAAQSSSARQSQAGWTLAFWFVQALVGAAIVFLASGAFLPWIRITGTVSQELDPLIQTGVGILSSIFGTDPTRLFSQEIAGLDTYGKLTLGIAAVSLLFLIVDMFFHRTWAVPGIAYLLGGLVAIMVIAIDLRNFSQLYDQVRALNLLFDIPVGKLIDGVDYLIDLQASMLTGLWLTILGLALLIVGGIGRLILALLGRSPRQ